MNNSQVPVARKQRLVVQEASDEVLVYDLETNKAHCLNKTAAFVWKSCDGKNSVADIARQFENHSGDSLQEDLVWLAIEQLNDKNLLESKLPTKFKGQTRREVLKKIGLTAVVALPVVASLTAPTAALAVACSGVVTSCIQCPDGTPCDVDADTVIGTCAGGACIGD